MSLLLVALLGLLAPLAPQQDEATDQYHYIANLYEKGFYDLTVKEAEKFLREHGNDKNADLARYRLASALFELDKKEEAATHFRSLATLEEFQFLAESLFRLGQCELEAGRNEAAADALGRALSAGGEYLAEPATFLLGEAHFRQGNFEEAERRYLEVLKLAPRGTFARDSAYGLCWSTYRNGDYAKAIGRIQNFLKSYSDDEATSELWFLMGESHLEADRPEEALQAYEKVQQGPFQDAAFRGAGFAQAALGNPQEAASYFARLISEYPASRFAEEAALHQGIQLLRANDPAAALEPLQMAVSLAIEEKSGERVAEALYWRSQAETRVGKHEEALASLDQAMKGAPAPEVAERINVARGDVLFALGRADEATSAYGQSGSAYAIHAAAVASLNAGRNEEAIRMSRTVIENFADSNYVPQAWLTLGEALLREKNYGEALDAFQRTLEDGSDDARRSRALSRIAWCQFLLEDFESAAQSFARVSEEFPNSIEKEEALFMRGRALESAGQKEGAVASWSEYLASYEQGGHRAEALMGLARLQEGSDGVEHLTALVSEYGEDPLVAQATYELAERQSAAEDFEAAEQGYRRVLENFPDHELVAPAQYGLAWTLFSTERYEEAAQTLAPIAQNGTEDPELERASLELLIWCQQKAGDPSGAAAAFAKFDEVCPNKTRVFNAARTVVLALREAQKLDEAQAMLGSFLGGVQDDALAAAVLVERAYLGLDRGNLEEGEAMAREALQRAPADGAVGEAFFFLGEAAFDQEQYEKAAELYAVASGVEACPVVDKAFYKQGFARLRTEDLEGASVAFSALTDGHAESELYGESLFLLGETLFRMEEYAQASNALRRLRDEKPRHEILPKALFRLGISLCKQEEWAEAEAALSDLARQAPEFENAVEADLWRGRALAGQNNGRAARQAFNRVVDKDRGVLAARARLGIGRLMYDSNNFEEALAEFLKVAVLYAHADEVSEGLYYAGQCLEQLGDQDRAMAQYREILDKYAGSAFEGAARQRLEEMGSAG